MLYAFIVLTEKFSFPISILQIEQEPAHSTDGSRQCRYLRALAAGQGLGSEGHLDRSHRAADVCGTIIIKDFSQCLVCFFFV